MRHRLPAAIRGPVMATPFAAFALVRARSRRAWAVAAVLALLTGHALFDFNRDARKFALRSVHAGTSAADVRAMTGFDYDNADTIEQTPESDRETLALIRGRVLDELSETYPHFAATMVAGQAA